MTQSQLFVLLLLACNAATPPERYGFVAVLGNDTVSVERISRSPERLVRTASTDGRSCGGATPSCCSLPTAGSRTW